MTDEEKKYEDAMLWIMGAEDAHNQLTRYINGLHERITTLQGENADLKKVVSEFASLSLKARDLVQRFNGEDHEEEESEEPQQVIA